MSRYIVLWAVVAVMILATGGWVEAAKNEQELIAVLKSDAPKAEKAITCKYLAIYGGKDAVPALAELLPDAELASWARIALEAIPDASADAALREAAGKLDGRLLIGVINSIGVRRDAGAADVLVARLADTDVEVVSAAAAALGRIGGDRAANALSAALDKAPAEARSGVAEGCIVCAERYVATGHLTAATKLYDTVRRRADLPQQRRLEATRGSILSRGGDGLDLLLEQLRSADQEWFGLGLRVARELPGRSVTEALATEMGRMDVGRQAMLLTAIADRQDAAVPGVIAKAAGRRDGPPQSRVVAVKALERLGDAGSVDVLLAAATDANSEVAGTARLALLRLGAEEVEAAIAARLAGARGKAREVLIDVAAQRRIAAALPAILASIEAGDEGVRQAAVQAVGDLGGPDQTADLVRLVRATSDGGERQNIERALQKVSGRGGAKAVGHLLPLMASEDAQLRVIGLHTLAIAGGPVALAAVKGALDDDEAAVQNEAVRVLSTWPNNWPHDRDAAEVLLEQARSGDTRTHQLLALRGYLQYVRGNDQLEAKEKAQRVRNVLGLISRPQEKQAAIAVLGGVAAAESLEMLMEMAGDAAVAEEACSAMVGLAGSAQGIAKEQRLKALELAASRAGNEATKKKAAEAISKLR